MSCIKCYILKKPQAAWLNEGGLPTPSTRIKIQEMEHGYQEFDCEAFLR